MLDLSAIKARAEAATPGPWDYDGGTSEDDEPTIFSVKEEVVVASAYETSANAAFIAAARTDVPALVAEVERLRGYLATVVRHGGLCDEGCCGPGCVCDDVRALLAQPAAAEGVANG